MPTTAIPIHRENFHLEVDRDNPMKARLVVCYHAIHPDSSVQLFQAKSPYLEVEELPTPALIKRANEERLPLIVPVVPEPKEEGSMDKITLDQEYQTRCGYPVKLYTVEGRVDYPIIGEYQELGKWKGGGWSSNGRCCNAFMLDLTPIPKKLKLECWVDVYQVNNQEGFYYRVRNLETKPVEVFASTFLKSIRVQDEVSL